MLIGSLKSASASVTGHIVVACFTLVQEYIPLIRLNLQLCTDDCKILLDCLSDCYMGGTVICNVGDIQRSLIGEYLIAISIVYELIACFLQKLDRLCKVVLVCIIGRIA